MKRVNVRGGHRAGGPQQADGAKRGGAGSAPGARQETRAPDGVTAPDPVSELSKKGAGPPQSDKRTL